MPANLPPTYLEAERRYREARTTEEKIEALEEMFAIIPKHKGTDKMQADIKRRISRHKEEAQKKKGAAKQKSAFSIEKEGASQVIVIGPPNAGKSSLITALTNAEPEIAPFPHTTHKPTPGMAPYENIQFQLVDTPPITADYVDPLMMDLVRRVDIVVILLDITTDPIGQYEEIMRILEEYRIFPEGTEVPENIRRPVFMKKISVVVNKVDGPGREEDFQAFLELAELKVPALPVSILNGTNLDVFLRIIYDMSGIIRVYSKNPGREPDMDEPFVIPRDSTLEDLAGRIHKDFLTKLKYARIWGRTVHDGMMVQRDYVMQDGDIVEIHL
ncbi:MAG TPA: 50S ribosome-binding GTPase [Deltaproteobacteria bacterium]|jgi:ribosome-interacting GTPase 1|nr:50S ribosome-binding GTPase [Deltaproteobacteria bacterium]OQC22467.1 MAG: GTPase Obg [Deltaproteobacteria bacterium ADurb.Bin072]HRW79701.1 50S ribosome-binding GTPase [Desulfomonilia bacterium]HNQ85596.1 50S ribosome-binding GTPase [Deltaproteobacteria bacterium]HNS89828.1 50S ribosome-binding GTPase [Deltaproteobacteria bacterium]